VCIICHYRSDSKLVPRYRRQAEHPDHHYACVRECADGLHCVDCRMDRVDANHVCPEWEPGAQPERTDWVNRQREPGSGRFSRHKLEHAGSAN
jgi:hypothetical protein